MINRKKIRRLHRGKVRRSDDKAAAVMSGPGSAGAPTSCMASGRRFRVLNVVDDVPRECLAVVLAGRVDRPARHVGHDRQ